MSRRETIDRLLDELHDLNPQMAEAEREAMGCVIPDDDDDFEIVVSDISEAILEARTQ